MAKTSELLRRRAETALRADRHRRALSARLGRRRIAAQNFTGRRSQVFRRTVQMAIAAIAVVMTVKLSLGAGRGAYAVTAQVLRTALIGYLVTHLQSLMHSTTLILAPARGAPR